jgi:prephenate dehydrogenase
MGLMGTSLGLALKARGFEGRIRGYARREATRETALRIGAVDEVFAAPADAVRDADIVVLCVPILSMPGLLAACAGSLKRGCLVTDVGSTKQTLAADVPPLLEGSGAIFVGSHPICGSEQRGVEAGDANLYQGAAVVLTPGGGEPEAVLDDLAAFWQQSGARTLVMPPAEHDRVLARTSHLPHMVAVALAATVAREGTGHGDFCGTGFRDTTRIAAGSPELWHDIAYSNSEALKGELVAFRSRLDEFISALDRSDYEALLRLLEQGAEARSALVGGSDEAAGS